MMKGNVYDVDTAIQVNVTFLNVALNQPADPSAVTLYVEDPSGTITTQGWPSGSIVRTGVGLFNFIFVPSGPGCWKYKWQGVGAVIATSRDTQFFVRASDLIAA
jgi:hypothetical protein